MYKLEENLVNDFVSNLATQAQTPWGPLQTTTEFFYQRGRTDVVAMNVAGEILAFEAKLTRWRDALQQAYRNTCFAHLSYIVVPEDVANRAVRYATEFYRRSVGICYPTQNRIVVVLEAQWLNPLQTWLSERAASIIIERGKYAAG